MNATPEVFEEMKKQCEKEEFTLSSHQWLFTDDGWVSPDGKFHSHADAYVHLMDRILAKKGWRSFVEVVSYPGKHKNTHRVGRRQSPATKKVYCFSDAIEVMDDESKEDLGMSGWTKMLQEALGDNFTGDVVRTEFHRGDDEGNGSKLVILGIEYSDKMAG